MHERLDQLAAEPRHVVVIGGGAVSGSEAAAFCADRGVTAIVLEQNPRPYGKIEDGLPRWHDKLRKQEYERIDANLRRPGVYFVPQTKLTADVSLETVRREWNASAVVLASGAWRDRPLPVPGADAFAGNGLVYQNAFVYWFNHYEEAEYQGPRYRVSDDAIVIGGGLASVDVVKIINIELYRNALRARGVDVSVIELEHKGITATLAQHHVDPDELGVRGCTLYYRRRVRDMPLAFARDGATVEQIEKTESVREKMVAILHEKFRVNVRDCAAPVAPISEGGRLTGLTFRRTEVRDGKSVEVAGSDFAVRSELIVSSIGSVPEALPGIPTRGELYDYANWETGALRGLTGVFGLGNVLTGKGNIRESRDNAADIATQVMRDYIGLDDDEDARGERTGEFLQEAHQAARAAARPVLDSAIRRAKTSPERLGAIARAIDERWQAAGYRGDYVEWMERHKPSDPPPALRGGREL
jgi:NADPH-dependent glutamate synthase beta subunit-like oxidoreductase